MRRLGSPMPTSLTSKRSYPQVGIANYPVPPRPRPTSPQPASPAQSQGSSELPYSTSLTRKPSAPRKALPAWEQTPSPDTQAQGLTVPRETSGSPLYDTYTRNGVPNGLHKEVEQPTEINPHVAKRPPSPTDSSAGSTVGKRLSSATTKQTNGTKVLPEKPLDAPAEKKFELSASEAENMRRLMSHATNVDECRIIVDMFLAKCGLPVANVHNPPLSPTLESPTNNIFLEQSLLELLLGCDDSSSDTHATVKIAPGASDPTKLNHGSGASPDTPATEWLRRFGTV